MRRKIRKHIAKEDEAKFQAKTSAFFVRIENRKTQKKNQRRSFFLEKIFVKKKHRRHFYVANLRNKNKYILQSNFQHK